MIFADMALAKARIDRTAELQVENEDRSIDRTINYWDHDQETRALKLRAHRAPRRRYPLPGEASRTSFGSC